jgi:hypothetical protein
MRAAEPFVGTLGSGQVAGDLAAGHRFATATVTLQRRSATATYLPARSSAAG